MVQCPVHLWFEMVQCQSCCSTASTTAVLSLNVNWTSHPSKVCVSVFGCSWLVTLCDVTTLSLLHSFTMSLYRSLSLHHCIWSIQSSLARIILYPYPPPARSLCACCCTYRAARRKKRQVKRESMLFKPPSTPVCRSLLFLCLSFCLSLILLLRGGSREAVERTEGK